MLYLCTRNRDVAQLVAHYVRDVGVGRSSRLIPTKKRKVYFSRLLKVSTLQGGCVISFDAPSFSFV